MQFDLSAGTFDATTLTAALRPIDPDAKITIDIASGRLDVVSVASREQILEALDKAGCQAEPAVHELHVSGGSTCCGGCS
ncbi:hypothetical protein WCE34_03270 [Luteimonas sp. MJ204]|uniref:hypothetical protein n=1 Tax=Luteimonas sp. MJ145 TaxID=3129234 RepID=UPI0031BB2ED9